MATIQIPQEYGYVILSAVSTFGVALWLTARVAPFRKAAKVPYPYEYASYEQIASASPQQSKALLLFNCAQRAHQNFNENHPTMLAALLTAGLKYPNAAATLGAIWSVNRVLYGIGYTNGKEGGKGRYLGVLWTPVHFGLIGMAGKAGWDIAMS